MTTSPSHRTPVPHRRTDPVPLAVWPVAQTNAQWQRAGRYHPGCAAHPGKMLPALAQRIVTEYSRPGDLVVDVMAGTGTTLIEAALLGRRAIGVELEHRWADLARVNADHVLDEKARRLVTVHQGDANELAQLLGPDAGRVDLVCTSPPYACDVGQPKVINGKLGSALERNYSTDRANLGHRRGPAYEAAMAAVYAACFAALRSGGLLVTVTKHSRRKGRTTDLAGLTVALAEGAGFTYVGHVIALHAAIRDGDLFGRPSFWQTTQTRKMRARGEPAHLVAHEDVAVFSRGPARLTSSTEEIARAH
jgi:modification methylase